MLFPAILLALIVGCKTVEPGTTEIPQGIVWKLISMERTGAAIEMVPATSAPTLSFDSVRAAGKGVCNSYSGVYRTSHDSLIIIGPIMSTKVGCEGIALEQRYFEMLHGAATYVVTAKSLRIFGADKGNVLNFSTE